MRKRVVGSAKEPASIDQGWLDLEHLSEVEVTSEETGYPVESALIPGGTSGWRASESGEQTIRLLFDEPLSLTRVHLIFEEYRRERTQEFVLRWSGDARGFYRETVRQQYTFSQPGATREVEDYSVNLTGVTVLELKIVPDIDGGDARASLISMRLA
jgi:hypothetical protein